VTGLRSRRRTTGSTSRRPRRLNGVTADQNIAPRLRFSPGRRPLTPPAWPSGVRTAHSPDVTGSPKQAGSGLDGHRADRSSRYGRPSPGQLGCPSRWVPRMTLARRCTVNPSPASSADVPGRPRPRSNAETRREPGGRAGASSRPSSGPSAPWSSTRKGSHARPSNSNLIAYWNGREASPVTPNADRPISDEPGADAGT
jgi:hypothetical protein